MQVTLEIPDTLAAQIIATGKDPAQAVLEALALDGYRTQTLSEEELRGILGFSTRMQVHTFLKEHETYLQLSLEDLEQDRLTMDQLFSESPLPLRRTG